MPAGKRRQSNAMLYTLITFVALFVIATTAAVIYYVKAEDFRTQATERQTEMNKLVSQDELRNLGTLVGTQSRGQSSLGTVIEDLDQMVRLVKGAPVRLTSAEVKVAEAKQAVRPLIEKARAYVTLPMPAPVAADPNAAQKADSATPADPNAAAMPEVALAALIDNLLAKLEQNKQDKAATDQELATLRQRFTDAVKDMNDTRQTLTAKVAAYEEQVSGIKGDYAKLSAQLDQTSKEQLGVIRGDLEKAQANAKHLNDDLLKTQAEFNLAQSRLQGALTQVSETKPAPDREAPAFKSDGSVFLVDQAAGVVHINLGSDDHVYQGLTFSIYDRTAGIPRDGKPKAQVEIFSIDPKVSAARVLSFDPRNPIATGDLIANLIWDSARQNLFVVMGDFDVNGDSKPDYDGASRIETLIRKWGGAVSKEVTSGTDYVILGAEPKVPTEPTPEVQTADPTAKERYDAARQRNEQFNQIRQRAEALWVPIFNYDRFLYFTGYANQISKPGAL